jgi:hypothetical protein
VVFLDKINLCWNLIQGKCLTHTWHVFQCSFNNCLMILNIHLLWFLHVAWVYVSQTWCYIIIEFQCNWVGARNDWRCFKSKKNFATQACEVATFCRSGIGIEFFEQIKIHYSNIINPIMTQVWLYDVAISKVDAKDKCQRLKVLNGNKTMKEENHFSLGPVKINDALDHTHHHIQLCSCPPRWRRMVFGPS